MTVTGGQVAIITGAGAGIGRSLALQLAAEGAVLVLLDVDGDAAAATGQLCATLGAKVESAAVDVSDWDALTGCARNVLERLGRVDQVFCIAGVIHTGDVLDTDPVDFERVWRVNTLGAFQTAKVFLPQLIASHGQLVFVSSAFGLMAAPSYSAYCSSKFAVRALAESLRQELTLAGQRVQVSCVYPGGVQTGIVRRGRFAVGVDRAAVEASFEQRVARTSPEDAAATILAGVRRGKSRIVVGRDARLVSAFVRLAGGRFPTVVIWAARAHRFVGSLSGSRRRE